MLHMVKNHLNDTRLPELLDCNFRVYSIITLLILHF